MVFDERVVAMAIAEVDAELAVLFNEAGGESAPAYERVKNSWSRRSTRVGGPKAISCLRRINWSVRWGCHE